MAMHQPDSIPNTSPVAPPGWMNPTILAAAGSGVISFCYAWWVLTRAAGFQPSADSHYHFTVARSMLHLGPWPSPADGLPWTILSTMPVDHYWAFHVLLVPFAAISDYEQGLKFATVSGFALVFAALGAFFARRQVSHPVAWALLCGIFSNQDWRYLQLRGAQLLVPLMLLAIELVAFTASSRMRNTLVVVVAWFAMLSYHGAILILPIAAVAATAAHSSDRTLGGYLVRAKSVTRDVGFVTIGLLLGLVLNPYADRHGSTFRFFAYHVLEMGRDRANLYADQPIAEFHGMSPELLVWHPEWGLLLLATLGALMWVVARALLRQPLGREVRVLGALAGLGLVLVSQAIRTREYAVPMAIALIAVLWGTRVQQSGSFRIIVLMVAAVALYLKVPNTVALARHHLPTNMYRGAGALLVENGRQPILNLAEADFGMLRIEFLDVVCAHALSRYFLLPNRDVFNDLWYLYRSPKSDESYTEEVLRRFHTRGVRIVATHGNRALDEWAKAHPNWLEVVFLSPVSAARLYRLTVAGSK